jgi:hypothetical protein
MYAPSPQVLRAVLTVPQGSRVFEGPDGLQYRWRPSLSTTDIVVSGFNCFPDQRLYRPLSVCVLSAARPKRCHRCLLSTNGSNTVSNWRRVRRTALHPRRWCRNCGGFYLIFLLWLMPSQPFSVFSDAPPGDGRSNCHCDVVSFLRGVEPLIFCHFCILFSGTCTILIAAYAPSQIVAIFGSSLLITVSRQFLREVADEF